MSKQILLAFIIMFLLACKQGTADKHQHAAKEDKSNQEVIITPTKKDAVDTVKKSIPAYVTNNINGHRITIRYHSPAVRNRIIWGGLVPYDQVWVTGAHSATTLESSGDFELGDKKIQKGKYAFFTIPGKDEWTIILNKNWNQHLADEYNAAADIVRLTLKPKHTEHQERLMYTIDQTGEQKCVLEMRWEKICVRVPVKLAD